MDWYRFHEGVCKWALWAGFHLCYDRHEIQKYFVEKNGIQSVILCIKNNPTSDVTRHGIAILFDIMRETSQNNDAATQARVIGFQEGLNELLMECTDKFEEDVEVRMMCQQILGSSESFAPTDKFDID